MTTPTPPGEGEDPPERPAQPGPPEHSGGYGQLNQPPPPPTGWGGAPEVPGYGQQPGGQTYGQYGAPDTGPVLHAAQPGIIPLRPLTLGEIYDGAFKAIRANPIVMFGLAGAVVAVITIIQGALTWGYQEQLYLLAGQANPATADLDELYSSLTASIVPNLATSLVTFVVTTVLNGVLIHSVSQSVIGRTLPIGELWQLVKPQLWRLLVLTLLISVAVVAVFVVCLVPGIVLMTSGEIAAGAGLMLLGLLVGLIAMLVVIIATVLATPVVVLERAKVFTSFRRSWQLARTSFWRLAGIYLLTTILVMIATTVVAGPISALGQAVAGVTGAIVAQLVATVIAGALTTPFFAAVTALLYVDIRIRTEALDVELAAAAEENP